jgi:transketolase
MAIAEAQLAARYNRPDHGIIDHHTFALVSDGDLMEGVVAEAASLAGHLALGKLICLYDDNSITLAAGTDITFSENGACRFAAYGWHKVAVADGNDLAIVAAAERLRGQGIAVRCVSMPSWELFEALPQSERDAVLPPSVGARLAVELGVQQGWDRYIGAHGDMLGVQRFGASAPADVLLREYGFTVDNVCARARARLVR